jgi:lipoprotein-anchoring transpeptidase ErfK/SrfK
MRLAVALLLAPFLAAAIIGTAQAEILITVDKSAQRMTVARDGEALYTWPVSTGRSSYATPSGSFSAFRMEADHYSLGCCGILLSRCRAYIICQLYGGPVRHSVRLTF